MTQTVLHHPRPHAPIPYTVEINMNHRASSISQPQSMAVREHHRPPVRMSPSHAIRFPQTTSHEGQEQMPRVTFPTKAHIGCLKNKLNVPRQMDGWLLETLVLASTRSDALGVTESVEENDADTSRSKQASNWDRTSPRTAADLHEAARFAKMDDKSLPRHFLVQQGNYRSWLEVDGKESRLLSSKATRKYLLFLRHSLRTPLRTIRCVTITVYTKRQQSLYSRKDDSP